MSAIYDFKIISNHENLTSFEFYVTSGENAWFSKERVAGTHNADTDEVKLSFADKVIMDFRAKKIDILEIINTNRAKVSAAVGSAIIAASISTGAPIESAPKMNIDGIPVKAAIFNSTDSDKYKGTIAVQAIREGILEAVKDHDTIISKNGVGKSPQKRADDITVIFVIDSGKITNKTKDQVADYTGAALYSNDFSQALKGGKSRAFATDNIKLSSAYNNNKIVFMSIPSYMADMAVDSKAEASALKAYTHTIMNHELTHAAYDFKEKHAVNVQCEFGERINPNSMIAKSMAAGVLHQEKRASSETSRLFSSSKLQDRILNEISDDKNKQEAAKMGDYLASVYKKRSENLILTNENTRYFVSPFSKERLSQQKENGALLLEYGGPLFQDVDFRKSKLASENSDSAPLGLLDSMARNLKGGGFKDESIKTFMNAYVKSGVGYEFSMISSNQSHDDIVEKGLASYRMGGRFSIEQAMLQAIEISAKELKSSNSEHAQAKHKQGSLYTEQETQRNYTAPKI